MKYIILSLLIVLGCCCQPDGYINGKPYRLKEKCIKEHKEKKKGYHYGYSWTKGYAWHWEWQCGINPCMETICDEKQIDTIWITNKNKSI